MKNFRAEDKSHAGGDEKHDIIIIIIIIFIQDTHITYSCIKITIIYNINCQYLNCTKIYKYIHARYNDDK
jgi:hypothetical protein